MFRNLLLTGLILIPVTAMAQQGNGSGGYVPPPLFAEPTYPEPKKEADVPKLPGISKEVSPAPAVVPEVKPETKISKPPEKKEEVPVAVPSEKPKVIKPVDEIVPVPALEPAPTPGVVKGPKTMPSVKKESVESQTTFESPDPSVTIMERVQDAPTVAPEISKKETLEIVPAPLPSGSIELKLQDDGSRMVVLEFDDKQSALSVKQTSILSQIIVPELNMDDKARLEIEAYASVQDNTISSDRRLALSRALEIRKFLLENGIESSRLDVRSLGAFGNKTPLDRAELRLVY